MEFDRTRSACKGISTCIMKMSGDGKVSRLWMAACSVCVCVVYVLCVCGARTRVCLCVLIVTVGTALCERGDERLHDNAAAATRHLLQAVSASKGMEKEW